MNSFKMLEVLIVAGLLAITPCKMAVASNEPTNSLSDDYYNDNQNFSNTDFAEGECWTMFIVVVCGVIACCSFIDIIKQSNKLKGNVKK